VGDAVRDWALPRPSQASQAISGNGLPLNLPREAISGADFSLITIVPPSSTLF